MRADPRAPDGNHRESIEWGDSPLVTRQASAQSTRRTAQPGLSAAVPPTPVAVARRRCNASVTPSSGAPSVTLPSSHNLTYACCWVHRVPKRLLLFRAAAFGLLAAAFAAGSFVGHDRERCPRPGCRQDGEHLPPGGILAHQHARVCRAERASLPSVGYGIVNRLGADAEEAASRMTAGFS